jgi:predicted DsbA family dithiol-disulfide isomerase
MMDRNFKDGGFINEEEMLSCLADSYGLSLGELKEIFNEVREFLEEKVK